MRKEISILDLLIGICLNISFFLSGCASFPAKELPSYYYNQLDQPAQKTSIDYDVTSADKMFNLNKICGEEIEKVFRESNIFSEFHPGTGTAKYHLSLACQNGYDNFAGRGFVAAVTGFLSGATFLILPGYANDAFVLVADVKKDDQILKHYEYHDSMNTWIELFMVFWMPNHSPISARAEIIDNMLLNFLHDLQKDKVFQI